MVRLKKIAGMVLTAGLAVGGFTASTAGTASAASTCGGSGSVSTVNGKLADGAAYMIQCPAGAWNGTLYLYSHGYVTPGSANPAQDAGDPVTAAWMLSHGYALAGSSYASTGWAIAQALPDQISTLNTFGSLYGKPRTTVAWGHSLGGIITAGLIQDFPKRFDAALPMCGVLSGGVATWNTGLDSAFAFQKLIAPSVQVVNITNPTANLQAAEAAGAQAQQTPQGRARLALVSALGDTPGWFTPLSPEPAATDYAAQEANQFLWGSQVTFPFAFALRAELEARAGGNPSWNTGVNYFADLAQVRRLQGGRGALPGGRAQPGPGPADAERLVADQGQPGRRGLPDQEHLLRRRHLGPGAHHAHHRRRPRRPGERAGLLAAPSSGPARPACSARSTCTGLATARSPRPRRSPPSRRWRTACPPGSGTCPARPAMNKAAAALGPQLNIFSSGGKIIPTAPAFISYSPAKYLRPFNLIPQFSNPPLPFAKQ